MQPDDALALYERAGELADASVFTLQNGDTAAGGQLEEMKSRLDAATEQCAAGTRIRVLMDTALERINICLKGDTWQLSKLNLIRCEKRRMEKANNPFAPPETHVTDLDFATYRMMFPGSAEEWKGSRAAAMRKFADDAVNTQNSCSILRNCEVIIQHGGHEQALDAVKRILLVNPSSFSAHVWHGILLDSSGKNSEAKEAFGRARALQDWAGLAINTTIDGGELPPAEYEATLLKVSTVRSDREKIMLYFALAHTNQKQKNHGAAVEFLKKANALHGLRENIPAVRAGIDRRKAVFTREYFRNSPRGDESSAPVFIVGMPRSGTSLLEKILGAHRTASGEKDVWAAGENMYPKSARDLFMHATGVPYPECMKSASPEAVKPVAEAYLSNLRDHVPEKERAGAEKIISKYPGDFLNIGHLMTLFPRAKFLHISRNPGDCAISILSRMMDGEKYSCDPENLGMYYQYCYRPMMEHWRNVLPEGSMMDITYEDLVRTPEAQLRGVLSFLDLPFSAECMRHETQATFSSTDLRSVRPISTSSLGTSAPYRQYLEPFFRHVPGETLPS